MHVDRAFGDKFLQLFLGPLSGNEGDDVVGLEMERLARLVRIATALRGDGRALGDGEERALGELVPEEVFLRKYAAEFDDPPSAELLAAFRQLLAEVEAGDVEAEAAA